MSGFISSPSSPSSPFSPSPSSPFSAVDAVVRPSLAHTEARSWPVEPSRPPVEAQVCDAAAALAEYAIAGVGKREEDLEEARQFAAAAAELSARVAEVLRPAAPAAGDEARAHETEVERLRVALAASEAEVAELRQRAEAREAQLQGLREELRQHAGRRGGADDEEKKPLEKRSAARGLARKACSLREAAREVRSSREQLSAQYKTFFLVGSATEASAGVNAEPPLPPPSHTTPVMPAMPPPLPSPSHTTPVMPAMPPPLPPPSHTTPVMPAMPPPLPPPSHTTPVMPAMPPPLPRRPLSSGGGSASAMQCCVGRCPPCPTHLTLASALAADDAEEAPPLDAQQTRQQKRGREDTPSRLW